MTDQHDDDMPLIVEITPRIASDLIEILKYMPESETEPTIEEVIAIATSYLKTRLESGAEISAKENI